MSIWSTSLLLGVVLGDEEPDHEAPWQVSSSGWDIPQRDGYLEIAVGSGIVSAVRLLVFSSKYGYSECMLDTAQVRLIVGALEDFLAYEATNPQSQSLAPHEGRAPFSNSQ